MKFFSLLLLIIISGFSGNAQRFDQAKFFRTYGYGAPVTMAATDVTGNMYVLGTFQTLLSIDNDTLSNPMHTELSLTKFSPGGMLLWNKQFGTSYLETPNKMAVDDAGHIYISMFVPSSCDTIFFEDTTLAVTQNSWQIIQFDYNGNYLRNHSYITGSTIHLATLGNDLYTSHSGEIIKHDSVFNTIWSRTMSNTGILQLSGFNQDGDIYVSDGGYIAVCGYEAGGGTFQLDTITMTFDGGFDDIGVILMDTSGSAYWGRIVQNPATILTNACAVDNNGNVYLSAQLGQVLYFGGDTLNNPSGSTAYAALLKYDSLGNEGWNVTLTTNLSNPSINDILVNAQQQVIVAGQYWTNSGTGLFGGLPIPDGIQPIISKVDQAGNVIWIKSDNAITNASAQAHSLALLPSGNEYVVTGQYYGEEQWGCFTSTIDVGIFAAVVSENSEVSASFSYNALDPYTFNFMSQSGIGMTWSSLFPGAIPSTSTLPFPTGITYSSPGSYAVTLIACNNICCDTLTMTIATVGVNELNGYNSAVIIYPNPFASLFNVSIDKKSIVSTEVYNGFGNRVYHSIGTGNSSSISIDATGWEAGIYFLKLNTGSETLTGKLMKTGSRVTTP